MSTSSTSFRTSRGRWLGRLAAVLATITGLLAVPAVVDAYTSPRTSLEQPAEGSTVTGDLLVTGGARHRKGVARVELVIHNLDNHDYWNGEGWQSEFVRVPVAVDKPGAKQTTWSYELDGRHLERANYRARAFARSVEGNGDSHGGDYNEFRYVPDLDPDLYDTEISTPTADQSIEPPISIVGRARSVDGVAQVNVVIRNKATDRYWDGASQSWVDDFVRTSAALSAEGATTVTWSVDVPADHSDPGDYFARAWVLTSSGKGDPFGRGQVHFTVIDRVTPDPTVPPTNPSTTSTTGPTAPPTTVAPPEEVIWEDTFDRLDPSRWTVEHSTYGDGNNELQCYRPENVSVASGHLVLRAVTETYTCPNGSTRQVTSGMVRSRGVEFAPGQAIEFRVKLNPADEDNQGGLWPAVWSSGWAGGGHPRGGEMDYLEVMTAVNPARSVYSIHFAKPDGSRGMINRSHVGDGPFSDQWHTVRFEYGRGGVLVWYLDGREVNRVTDADTVQGWPAPFDQATGEIKINLALGGRPGPLDPRALGADGATFVVDYIRVVALDGGDPTTTTTAQPTTTTTAQPTTTARPTTTVPSTTTTAPPPDDCPNGDRSVLVPCHGVLVGASGDFRDGNGVYQHVEDDFRRMEQRLGADFDIFHQFLQWNELVDKPWPNPRASELAADGRILFTNWKSPTGHPNDWRRIATGDYDDDIVAAARTMAAFGQPTFLTFYHEPEDNIRDAAGADPALVDRYIDDYRAAFRHIHHVFEANGADNVVWVWDMQGWLGGFADYYEGGLYPGDDVVDWVAWNPYNWHQCDNHGNQPRWKSFTDVVAPFYDWLDAGGPGRPSTDKPLMLGEWGSEENQGAPNSDQTKAEWLDEARQVLPERFPRLKAVVYFDTEGQRADGSVQFCRWGIDSSVASAEAMSRLLTDDRLTARW